MKIKGQGLRSRSTAVVAIWVVAVAELKAAKEAVRKIDIVLARQEEMRKALNRLDERDRTAKKSTRRRFSTETQELVFGYWERGQRNPTLRCEAGNHRVMYEQVFAYYTPELKALGIKSGNDFKSCIKLRSNRIHRSRITR